ncbi:hypothetical protein GOP47_0028680 [Adiantum capillus-veneris]|nr:hypothetical protein GOP47_0028680 [Adiantum capillus-veneris]
MDVPNGRCIHTHEADSKSADAKSDVFRAVTDLVGAAQHMQHDPASIEGVEVLIDRLKHLLHAEKHAYTLTHQNSEKRKKIESLHNLIQYLELQVQKASKAVQRSGLKYYLASVSSTVLGDEVTRIGQSMGSKLQSWLDQQGVRELADIISNGSEDARIEAISSLKDMVRNGYDALLQETILSCGLVQKLAALLRPSALVSWDVQKEAALALCALLDFNKDIFLSLVLMAKVVENLVKLMDTQPEGNVVILVCVLKGFLSAGQTIVVDEIHTHDGVPKIVNLLDHKSQALTHAAMDCVFEMAYYGRMEVVQKMFALGVVQKLATLHQSSIIAGGVGYVENELHSGQERGIVLGGLKGSGQERSIVLAKTPETSQVGGGTSVLHPFSNAVTRFALHFAVGTGLRKRERRALKLEFLKQIGEIMPNDAEAANITAEVLWAP